MIVEAPHINDRLVFLVIAAIELSVLLTEREFQSEFLNTNCSIFLVSFLLFTILIDGIMPSDSSSRLFKRDLSETLSAAFLFLFLWQMCFEIIVNVDSIEIVESDESYR